MLAIRLCSLRANAINDANFEKRCTFPLEFSYAFTKIEVVQVMDGTTIRRKQKVRRRRVRNVCSKPLHLACIPMHFDCVGDLNQIFDAGMRVFD